MSYELEHSYNKFESVCIVHKSKSSGEWADRLQNEKPKKFRKLKTEATNCFNSKIANRNHTVESIDCPSQENQLIPFEYFHSVLLITAKKIRFCSCILSDFGAIEKCLHCAHN